MDISISSRHTRVTPRLEEVIEEKIGGLDRFLADLDTAIVHLAEARNPRINDKESCEVHLKGGGHHLRCKVTAPDAFAAIDAAADKLERQIRKLRTRLERRRQGDGRSIRTDGGAAVAVEATTATEVEDEGEALPRIVKTKRFHLGPLTPEEAVLKMELLGHGFFFFINKDTGRSAVVYRRDDGDVGLIDEAE